MKKRGGAGKGQGRKPDLTPEDAKLIREDCESRARVQRRKQWEKRIERNLAKRNINWGNLKPVYSTPPQFIFKDDEQRKQWERLNENYPPKLVGLTTPVSRVPLKYRQDVAEYGSRKPDKKIPESLPEQVKYVIQMIRDNKRARGRRQHYSTQVTPRLYGGQRQKIIAEVARSWGVSPRAVRTIWEAKSVD